MDSMDCKNRKRPRYHQSRPRYPFSHGRCYQLCAQAHHHQPSKPAFNPFLSPSPPPLNSWLSAGLAAGLAAGSAASANGFLHGGSHQASWHNAMSLRFLGLQMKLTSFYAVIGNDSAYICPLPLAGASLAQKKLLESPDLHL